MPENDNRLWIAVTDGLKSCIHDHGPITKDVVGSAAKRIIGHLKNVFRTPEQFTEIKLKNKRWRTVILGRQKARLALKMAIQQMNPDKTISEHRDLFDKYTKAARIIVDAEHNEHKERELNNIACRYGEEVSLDVI